MMEDEFHSKHYRPEFSITPSPLATMPTIFGNLISNMTEEDLDITYDQASDYLKGVVDSVLAIYRYEIWKPVYRPMPKVAEQRAHILYLMRENVPYRRHQHAYLERYMTS